MCHTFIPFTFWTRREGCVLMRVRAPAIRPIWKSCFRKKYFRRKRGAEHFCGRFPIVSLPKRTSYFWLCIFRKHLWEGKATMAPQRLIYRPCSWGRVFFPSLPRIISASWYWTDSEMLWLTVIGSTADRTGRIKAGYKKLWRREPRFRK